MNFGSYYKGLNGEIVKCIGRAYGSKYDRDDMVLYCEVNQGTASDVQYCTDAEFETDFREIA